MCLLELHIQLPLALVELEQEAQLGQLLAVIVFLIQSHLLAAVLVVTMMELALEAMAGQVAGHHDFPAQVVQAIPQALRRPKARTVVEVLIPAHTPEQVVVEAVRQALRVVLGQGQAPALGVQERHQALLDQPLLTRAAVAAALLKMELAHQAEQAVVAMAATAATQVMTAQQTLAGVAVEVGHPTVHSRLIQRVALAVAA